MDQKAPNHPSRRLVGIGLLGWLAMLGVDFFLHGGVLAKLYTQPSPFLLPPLDAFRRIPLGYASLLLLNVLLLWLMLKLGLSGWRQGLAFGLQLGVLMGVTAMLSLYSISTAGPSLLVGWFVGQVLQMGTAGAVIGSGLAGQPLRIMLARVMALIILLVVVTITMQSIGLVPAVYSPTQEPTGTIHYPAPVCGIGSLPCRHHGVAGKVPSAQSTY